MTIEEALSEFVLDSTAVQAIIGNRLYPNRIVQGADFPMMAYVSMEQEPLNGQGGICAREFDFMFHISSYVYKDCVDMREVLITLLDKYQGVLGGNKISMIRYDGTSLNVQENETDLYHISIDFKILINK